MKPKVLLADDHAMVLEAIGEILGEATELVGQVTDGRQLVESARRLLPDVVVTDLAMPVMSGLDAMRLLKSEKSLARFIVMTADRDPELAAAAMDAGASGYVFKQAVGEELLDAIQAVMAGRTYLTPLIGPDRPRTPTAI